MSEEVLTPLLSPYNVTVSSGETPLSMNIVWEYDKEDIEFKIYINDMFEGITTSEYTIHIDQLIPGETYKINVSAYDNETGVESVLSESAFFEVEEPEGMDNPRNWNGVRLDNITVFYEK